MIKQFRARFILKEVEYNCQPGGIWPPAATRKKENAQTASGLILRYMRARQTATTWVM